MLCNYNENLESKNFVDGVNFTRNDPCIFVVYPSGASGDLLISIIDKHYLRTGCEYYGIEENGRVHLYTADYGEIDIKINNMNRDYIFSDQYLYDLADKLGEKNLNYSLLDQIVFGCHLHSVNDITKILEQFKQAKIINIYPQTAADDLLIQYQAQLKLRNIECEINNEVINGFVPEIVTHNRVLNVSYRSLFTEHEFEKTYDSIVDFLNLKNKLIRFDYIKFYISKQSLKFQQAISVF